MLARPMLSPRRLSVALCTCTYLMGNTKKGSSYLTRFVQSFEIYELVIIRFRVCNIEGKDEQLVALAVLSSHVSHKLPLF